jgi:hypothetical protein
MDWIELAEDSDRVLVVANGKWTCLLHKMLEMSWLAGDLLAPQERLCSMESVIRRHIIYLFETVSVVSCDSWSYVQFQRCQKPSPCFTPTQLLKLSFKSFGFVFALRTPEIKVFEVYGNEINFLRRRFRTLFHLHCKPVPPSISTKRSSDHHSCRH